MDVVYGGYYSDSNRTIGMKAYTLLLYMAYRGIDAVGDIRNSFNAHIYIFEMVQQIYTTIM